MDLTSMVVVLALVFGVPLLMAWAQSRWELRHERRRSTAAERDEAPHVEASGATVSTRE